MNSYLPLICGIAGKKLSLEEIKFIKEYSPWGIILFERNCISNEQVRALTEELKNFTHEFLPIFIDQEGGRVSRINYSNSYEFLPARRFGEIILKNNKLGKKALYLNTQLSALILKKLGINTNTIPVLDIPSENESGIIGDRSYSLDKEIVSMAGEIVISCLLDHGIAPVIKHIPGHGRASVDSHLDLPIVDTDQNTLFKNDFYPFIENNNVELAMTAHITYSAIDPNNPATLSKEVILKVIRETINYQGLLITDDISMKAITIPTEQAAIKALESGCDLVLHCNGNLNEMNAVAQNIKDQFELISIPEKVLDTFKVKSEKQLDELEQELKNVIEALE